ncbi:MAG: endonuclease domain-containing protein [Pseudomonadota bacterium]
MRQTTIGRAQTLRRSPTVAEDKLWLGLRSKQLGGLRFRRQHPVEPYILDFACVALKLAVEVDGATHGTDEEIRYDERRTAELEKQGWTVVRFPNEDVFRHCNAVLDAIWKTARRMKP